MNTLTSEVPLVASDDLVAVVRALTLISHAAWGAANNGSPEGDHYELFLAIGGAVDEALRELHQPRRQR